MKKVFLCICCIIGILAGTRAPLYAAVPADFELAVDVNRDNYDISISGTSSAIQEGQNISLMILKPDYTSENIGSKTKQQIIESIHQNMTIKAQEDGRFSFDFRMTGNSGLYTVRIGGLDYETFEDTFFFYGSDYVDILFGNIDDATDEDNIDSTELHGIISVELNREILGLVADTYDGGTKTSEILFGLKPFESVSDLQTKFKLASLLAEIQDGDAQNVIDTYGAELGFGEAVYTGYTGLSAEKKTAIATDLKSKALNQPDKLQEAFNENVLMTIAKGFNNYSALDAFYSQYETALAFNEADYNKYISLNSKSEVNKVVIKKLETINTLDALRQAFSAAVSVQNQNSNQNQNQNGIIVDTPSVSGGFSGGGSSSGGGGFSGGGGKASQIVVENPSETNNKVQEEKPQTVYVYADVSSEHWAYEAVSVLSAKKIISGVGDNRFAPEDYVTREQMVKLLIEAFNKNTGKTETSFEDVSEDAWYREYIASAEEIGLIKGDGVNFGVGGTLCRQDMAVMAYRMIGIVGSKLDGEKSVFSDDAKIADYAKDAVYAMQASGIINGTGNGEFSPEEPCTRAMAAQVIYKLLKFAE